MSRRSTRIKIPTRRLKDDSIYESSEGFMSSSSNKSCTISAITTDIPSKGGKWMNTSKQTVI